MSLQNKIDFAIGAPAPRLSATTNPEEKIDALYLRWSKDEYSDDESQSIENQRKILRQYAEENGLTNLEEFIDDGWTGVDFVNRPEFNRMIEMVRDGKIRTLIVKDLSRFGRERNFMGIFTEYLFPQHNVRFIAIGDSVDSARGESDVAPFINLFNEWHVKSTSQKVRAVKDMKARQGKNVNGSYPYGYNYDKEQGKLVIDDVSAPVVKRIFQLFLEGNGLKKIANILSQDGVPTYCIYHGHKPINPNTAPEIWSAVSVKRILENKAYVGCRVNKQTYSISYKQKKRFLNKESDILVFEDAHEPIIEQDIFDMVQRMRQSRKRLTKKGEQPIYSGLLFCADCGKNHYLSKGREEEQGKYFYICGNYRAKVRVCTPHSIKIASIENILYENLQSIARSVAENEMEFAERLMKNGMRIEQKVSAARKSELESKMRRNSELDMLIQKLFEQHVINNLPEARYLKLSQTYELEQKELRLEIASLENEVSTGENTFSGIEKFIKIVKKHINVNMLDYVVLRELVEKIVIHEKTKETVIGTKGKPILVKRQQVDIYYNFVGFIGQPELTMHIHD